jgi:hypothetical protein
MKRAYDGVKRPREANESTRTVQGIVLAIVLVLPLWFYLLHRLF